LGPVRATYRQDAPDWMRKGDFHSTLPVWVRGEIRTGYTCNVLLRMTEESLRNRRFSLARGQTGGEDTEFFDHMVKAGGRIAFAPRAFVD
ncbi:MAG: glycosyltransferase family 2 protein, partial [Mesorhizobium sp.]